MLLDKTHSETHFLNGSLGLLLRWATQLLDALRQYKWGIQPSAAAGREGKMGEVLTPVSELTL